MKKKKTIEVVRIDLTRMPVLRKQLVEFCYGTYEENVIIDDDHLEMEYYLLIKENRLNELFMPELLKNGGGLLFVDCIVI
jgi:hypothetical protein